MTFKSAATNFHLPPSRLIYTQAFERVSKEPPRVCTTMLSASFVRCGTGTLAWKIAPLQGGKSEVCSRVVLLYDKLHGVVTESAMSIIEEDLR